MQQRNERSRKTGNFKWSRREILGAGAGVLAAVGSGCATRSQTSTVSADLEPRAAAGVAERYSENVYTRLLGVEPHLPACDHITAAGGSRMPREVIDAMREANEYFVDMRELTLAAGRRLAEVTKTEDALVSAGAFSAMVLGAAACLTGTDPEKIAALPHPTWPERECLTQKAHRFSYDRAYRAAGMHIVEVETREELRNAVNENTAMISVLARLEYEMKDDPKVMTPRELVELGRKAGVPVMVDAAAEIPPGSTLTRFSEMGADLVVISGGKGLRGPQSTGILAGRKDLIEAARTHASPNGNLGRGMKVGKEEIIGLIVALNRYIELDHESIQEEWNRKARFVADRLKNIEGLNAEYTVNGRGYADVLLSWDERIIPLSQEEVREKLQSGSPRVSIYQERFATRCLEQDELVVATERVRQFFREEAKTAVRASGEGL